MTPAQGAEIVRGIMQWGFSFLLIGWFTGVCMSIIRR